MSKTLLLLLVVAGLAIGILGVSMVGGLKTEATGTGKAPDQAQISGSDSAAPSLTGADAAEVHRATNGSDSLVQTTRAGSPANSTPSETDSGNSTQNARQGGVNPTVPERAVSTISGVVQDEEGLPLANIEVLAEPIVDSGADVSTDDAAAAVLQSAWTAFDGAFYFENLKHDEYRIRTAPSDLYAPAGTTARAGEQSVNLVLKWFRQLRVHGSVADTRGTPLAGVRVIAGPPTRVTTTGPKGEYELDISVEGKNNIPTVRFRRDGYREQAIPLEREEMDFDLLDYPLDVALEPLEGLTTVTGRLLDPDGRPVAGKILSLRSSRLKSSHSAQSDQQGRFSVQNVEPGKDYLLTIRPGGDFRDYRNAGLAIPASGLELDIVLERLPHGELAGFMIDLEGNPVPGFSMTLHSQAATGRRVQVVGDHRGHFWIGGFPEGNAILKTSSYPVFETQGIRVAKESEAPVPVILDMGPYALQGTVRNSLGEPVPAPEITLGWQYREGAVQNFSARRTTADLNGYFAFTGLGPGFHTLRVNAPGFKMAVVQVDVGLDTGQLVVELLTES